jgi:hypothetical protein
VLDCTYQISTVAIPSFNQDGDIIKEMSLAEKGIFLTLLTHFTSRRQTYEDHYGSFDPTTYTLCLDNITRLCRGCKLTHHERSVRKFIAKYKDLIERLMHEQTKLEADRGGK